MHSQKKKMTKSARSCSVLEEFPGCNDYLIAANDSLIGKSLEKSRVCLCVELPGFLFTPSSHSAPIRFHFPSGFSSSFSSIIFSLPHTEHCEHYLVPLAAWDLIRLLTSGPQRLLPAWQLLTPGGLPRWEKQRERPHRGLWKGRCWRWGASLSMPFPPPWVALGPGGSKFSWFRSKAQGKVGRFLFYFAV